MRISNLLMLIFAIPIPLITTAQDSFCPEVQQSRIPSTTPHFVTLFKDTFEWRVQAGEQITVAISYSCDRVATAAIYSVETDEELIGNFHGKSGFVEKDMTRNINKQWVFHLSATGDISFLAAGVWDLTRR